MADNLPREQDIRAILKEAESGANLSELCRKHDITPSELHLWKLKFGEPEPGEAFARSDPALRIMKFMAAAVAVIGLALWLWSGYNLAVGSTNPRFANMTGKVITSERVRLTGEQGTDRFVHRIVYEYSVNGKRYTSDRVRFGPTSARDNEGYPVGRQVTVFFDEQQPSLSVLEQEIPPDVIEPFKIGSYWLAAALIVGCIAWWYGDKLVES